MKAKITISNSTGSITAEVPVEALPALAASFSKCNILINPITDESKN